MLYSNSLYPTTNKVANKTAIKTYLSPMRFGQIDGAHRLRQLVQLGHGFRFGDGLNWMQIWPLASNT